MAIDVKINTSKLTTRIKNITATKVGLNKQQAQDIGSIVANRMKELISSGSSPIAGKGNFSAYRGGYRKRIQSGRISGKSLSPVNLKLSGKFLNSLRSLAPKLQSGSFLPRVGFDKRFDRDADDKEQGHREGHNNQAQRPIIPEGKETLRRSIFDSIKAQVTEYLEKNLKQLLK
jgi:hypothetical protein